MQRGDRQRQHVSERCGIDRHGGGRETAAREDLGDQPPERMADDHRRVIKLSDDRLAMGRDIADQMLVGLRVIERIKRRYVGARRSKSSTVRRSENNLARSRRVRRGTSGMLLAWWPTTDSIFAKSASSPPECRCGQLKRLLPVTVGGSSLVKMTQNIRETRPARSGEAAHRPLVAPRSVIGTEALTLDGPRGNGTARGLWVCFGAVAIAVCQGRGPRLRRGWMSWSWRGSV